jgi:ankyrin repeat protein
MFLFVSTIVVIQDHAVKVRCSPAVPAHRCSFPPARMHAAIRLRGGKGARQEEGEEEDPLARQRIMGDTKSEIGRRVLAKRLRQATNKGSIKDIEAALADGADVHGLDLAGFSCLHLAAEIGKADVVSLFLSKVCLIWRVKCDGAQTCMPAQLWHSFRSRMWNRISAECEPSIFLHFLQGADPNARDGISGRSPLHHATVQSAGNMVELVCVKAPPTPSSISVSRQLWNLMQRHVIFFILCAQLVDGGAEVDARDDANRTPLAVAAWQGNADAVEALLSRGADVDARDLYVLSQLLRGKEGGRERERERERE